MHYDENYCYSMAPTETETIDDLKNTVDKLLEVIKVSGKINRAIMQMLKDGETYDDNDLLISNLLKEYDKKITEVIRG